MSYINVDTVNFGEVVGVFTFKAMGDHERSELKSQRSKLKTNLSRAPNLDICGILEEIKILMSFYCLFVVFGR